MKPKTKTINVMLLDGGVGDDICSLVAVDYMIRKYPWITPLVWTKDFLVDFAKNVLPEGTYVKGYSEMRGQYDPTRPTKTTKWDGNTSPMKIHLLDYAFLRLLDENPPIYEKNYLRVKFDQVKSQVFDLPSKYVVFTTGFTAGVREWIAPEVNKTAKYVLDKGYIPVFLGQTQTKTGLAHVIEGKFNEQIDFNLGINLIDKTNLLEAATIMQHSSGVLGVDNGLLHVAGCTDAKIVGGFTTVSPQIRMAIRHDILGWEYYPVTPNSSACDKLFCQEKTNFLYGHDYRNCLFKDPDRKLKCIQDMTADRFITQLEKFL